MGLFSGTRAAAWLIDRFGSRRVIQVSLPLLPATLLGPALAPDLIGLTAVFVVHGAVLGLLDVAMNAHAVAVERAYQRPIMSGLHGVWSAGVLAAAAVGSGAAAVDVGVLRQFGLAAVLLVPAGALATRGLSPAVAERVPRDDARRGRRIRRLVPTALIALSAIGFSSFLGEGAAADWSGVYVRDRVGAGEGLAALAFTAFALGMTAARFTADRLSARFGPVAVVRAGGSIAALGLALALLAPRPAPALGGFLLFGLGLGPIVPLVFSAAGNLGGGSAARALGWVITVSYAGSVLGPAAIGWIATAVSLRAGLVLPLALAAVTAALSSYVRSAAGG